MDKLKAGRCKCNQAKLSLCDGIIYFFLVFFCAVAYFWLFVYRNGCIINFFFHITA